MLTRLQAVADSLSEGAAALVITPVNRRYLTGFPSSLGYLFVLPSAAVLYVDSRYYEAAGKQAQGVEVRLLHKLKDAVDEICRGFPVEQFLLETGITVADLLALQKVTHLECVADGRLSKTLETMRAVKTDWEVEQILAAQSIAEAAFADLLGIIRPGVTEAQLAVELDYRMRKLGAEEMSFETIAVAGANSSLPHGVPGERQVADGDFIVFDFGAVKNGYHSDMTRTVAVGHATEEMQRVYATVLEAHYRCLETLRPGLCCADGDAAARKVIEAAGYGAYFGHATGHSVGLEIHEEPRLSPNSEDVLKIGNVVTDEPGIYLPGKFGVRIEDMVLITADGACSLNKTPKDLLILA